jgi:hypothetical protein
MLPGSLNYSSAKLISLGIFQLLISNLVTGVMPVMLGNIAQSNVVCQSVCLDLKCSETLWCVAVFTLLIPCIDVCVWVLGSRSHCTHLSVIKCDSHCQEVFYMECIDLTCPLLQQWLLLVRHGFWIYPSEYDTCSLLHPLNLVLVRVNYCLLQACWHLLPDSVWLCVRE